jgi:hypothetical protein
MAISKSIAYAVLVSLGLALTLSGCIVEPRGGYREGYYDREHHRWWHERTWRECGERDEHCRD